MISALKLVSVNRGYDPRDFALVAFGGAGGMHAVALASELGIGRIVIPRAADVFSAWGVLMSDLRRDLFLTRLMPFQRNVAAEIDGLLRQVVQDAERHFLAEGIDGQDIRVACFGSMRYANQEHTLEVPFPDRPITAEAVDEVIGSFHTHYEQHYTYRLDTAVELVEVHVVATAEVGKLKPVRLPSTGRSTRSAAKAHRNVDYAEGGVHTADIYDGELLESGMTFSGPAVVETSGTTIVVHPHNTARVDEFGNLHIAVNPAS
jgi:N-methylhydantoinase A